MKLGERSIRKDIRKHCHSKRVENLWKNLRKEEVHTDIVRKLKNLYKRNVRFRGKVPGAYGSLPSWMIR